MDSMKTTKKEEKEEENREERRSNEQKKNKDPKSEKTENLVAVFIFLGLIILGIGLFTNGFGLLEKSQDNNVRIRVPLGNDPFTGSENASVLIIAFSDYECPSCVRAEQSMKRIREQFKDDVIYVFKDFPLIRIHPNAYNAALAAECAKEQDKYWEYHDVLYEHNNQLEERYLQEYAKQLELDTSRFNKCLKTQKYKNEVDEDIQTGRAIGVTGAPFFFINGIKVIGAQPEETFIKIINEELKNK